MESSLEEELFELLYTFDISKDVEAKAILQSASDTFNINWNNGDSKWGFLHRACCYDRSDMVAELTSRHHLFLHAITMPLKVF